MREGYAPDRIHDLLTTFAGEWFTTTVIYDWMAERHGINKTTAMRAVQRLKQAGLVESRTVETNGTWPTDASHSGYRHDAVKRVWQVRAST